MSIRTVTYGTFRSIQEVAKRYQIALDLDRFIQVRSVAVDERFAQDIAYVQDHIDVPMSEVSIGEFLIAPILKEVWKSYSDFMLIWSHVPLNVEGEFEGFPDYLFTKISPLGLVRDKPYILGVEAKRDDFDAGWAQCLVAMLAAQKINQDDAITLYGIVTNGKVWEFGFLEGKRLTRDPRSFIISDLPGLFGALHDVFDRAKEQILGS